MPERKYDLERADDVRDMAVALSIDLNREVMPMVKAMAPEHRPLFFCTMLSSFVGTMGASMGPDVAGACLDTLKSLMNDVAAKVRASAH